MISSIQVVHQSVELELCDVQLLYVVSPAKRGLDIESEICVAPGTAEKDSDVNVPVSHTGAVKVDKSGVAAIMKNDIRHAWVTVRENHILDDRSTFDQLTVHV
jgi:hypothetical protein